MAKRPFRTAAAKNSFSTFSPIGNAPLVSCIIIFFNNQPFLAEAIESVLAQSYQHWELLLVDDGSTDGSSQVALRYAQSYPRRVRYLSHLNHRNRGKSTTRNLGIEQAKGALIALLDGDDVWLPSKLTEQVVAFQQHPTAGMVYGRTRFWYSWASAGDRQQLSRQWSKSTVEKEAPVDSFPKLAAPPDTLVEPPALAISLMKGGFQTPTTCNAIVRKEVFEQVGGFDENYADIFEDQTFFLKVELYFPVFIADSWWANYRQHPGSTSHRLLAEIRQKPGFRHTIWLEFLSWIKAYLSSQQYEDDGVWKCLRDQQRWLKKRRAIDTLMSVGRQILPLAWRDLRHRLVQYRHRKSSS